MSGLIKLKRGLLMSCDHDLAIEVSQVGKVFHIYDQPIDRLKQSLLPGLHRAFGLKPSSYCKNFNALEEVSFAVKKGGALGILGKNGAGKSTLLQIICDTLQPTTGHVSVNGRVAALLELGAGFNPEFTGRENVYLNASVLGMSEADIDERYDNILAFADIGDFIDQPVKIYSSGMYVRLAFAVIAHVDADILIIDEALSVGDVFFTQKCMRFLREFKERGTLLFVSHDTSSIVNFCDSCIWLEGGMVKMNGTAKDVTEKYLQGLYEQESSCYGKSLETSVDEEVITNDPISEAATNFEGDSCEGTYDQRMELINNSKFRNDIELFVFDRETNSFGVGGAKIVDVKFTAERGETLSWMVGGEMVSLVIRCQAIQSIMNPIIGFQVKDKLGQIIFGDNTFLTYMEKPVGVVAGESFQSVFTFRMPLVPNGDYTIAVAIAEGTQERHVQHEWLHDALAFKAHSSAVCFGLLGVPMADISISKL